MDYKFSDNVASASYGPDVYRGSTSVTFSSSCGNQINCFNDCLDQDNFGYGHLMCYNCAKDMPQDLKNEDCKSLTSSSTVTSQATFENAIITGNTINLASDFLVASEIVILDVSGLVVDGHSYTINGGSASRIFYLSNSGTELTIMDLVLTNGYSSSSSYGGQYGGAMYIGSGVTLVMSACTFSNNLAVAGYGGALNLGSTSGTSDILITLTSCNFLGNSVLTNGYGGGMYIGTGVTVTITDCDFLSNVGAHSGGGISQYAASTTTLTRVTFTSNSASTYGGGYHNNGAAASVTSFIGCTFTSNTATTTGRGGGVSPDV
jgi:hypothetical protein